MKVNHHFNDHSQGYVNLYFGQDFLKGGSTDYKTSDDNLYYESKDIGKLRWGNTVASAGWSYVMNHKMFSNISAYYTRYNSSIRRIEENQTGKKDDEEYKSLFKFLFNSILIDASFTISSAESNVHS